MENSHVLVKKMRGNQFQKSGCQENKANQKIKEELENPKKAEKANIPKIDDMSLIII